MLFFVSTTGLPAAGRASCRLRPSGKSQQSLGVFLQDQRFDLVLEAGFVEVFHPALGRDQRVIAVEQHAVFQQGVGVLHQL